MTAARTVLIPAVAALALIAGAAPAYASGGSGGGGTGGGGGGGGGTSVGAITTASSFVACDAGTSVGVTYRKGFQKRVEVQLSMDGAPLTATTNTLGGTWEVQVWNLTTGTRIGAMATTASPNQANTLITWLTSTVPVGTSDLQITLTRRDQGSSFLPDPVPTPVLETCTATTSVVAR